VRQLVFMSLILVLSCFTVSFAEELPIYETRLCAGEYLGTEAVLNCNKRTGQAWVRIIIEEDWAVDDECESYSERVVVPGLHYDDGLIKYNNVVLAKVGFLGLKFSDSFEFKIEEKDSKKKCVDHIRAVKDIRVTLLIYP